MIRRAFFVAIASSVAACSLFVDLDGLSGGGAGGGGDVFVPADVTANDAAPSDASDAGPSIDAAHFSCPDASIVCDDFDDTLLGALWSRTDNQNGTLVIDDDASVSPPNSLHVVLPDNTGSVTRINRLEKDIDSLASLQCDFDVRLVATDSTSDYDVQLFGVNLSVPGYNDWEIQINLQATGLYFEQDTDTGQDGGAVFTSEPFSAMSSGVWRHVRIATDFQSTQVSVDGVKVYDKPLATQLSPTPASGTLAFGNVSDTEPPGWDYRLDNVVCVAP